MITVNGVLTVKQISGANGKFCTGDLNTSIGEFKVKEAILDQFEEGRYQGEFIIERFYLSSYVWRGKSTTDIRAKVTDIRLDKAEEGEVDNSIPEPDPINDIKTNQSASKPDATFSEFTATEKKSQYLSELENPAFHPNLTEAERDVELTKIEAKHQSDLNEEDLSSIFGDDLAEAILASMPVKLDPTIERSLFRKQRDSLKARGYLFNAKTQAWTKSEVEND